MVRSRRNARAPRTVRCDGSAAFANCSPNDIPRYGAVRKNLGKFASVKTGRVAWYESLLEKDFMYLLDYDRDVSYWHEQPLRIRFSHGAKVHRYTPDLEVHRAAQKQLIEVKPKHKVDSGEWDVLFRAAESYRSNSEWTIRL